MGLGMGSEMRPGLPTTQKQKLKKRQESFQRGKLEYHCVRGTRANSLHRERYTLKLASSVIDDGLDDIFESIGDFELLNVQVLPQMGTHNDKQQKKFCIF